MDPPANAKGPPGAAPVPGMGRFPDQNPHPVLRMDASGILVYANASSLPIREAWAVEVGQQVPTEIAAALRAAAAADPPGRVEAVHGWRTFDVLAIRVDELDAWNLYGTDITAERVVERFPGQNPNPVLRMNPGGELIYANEASRPITIAFGIRVGDALPARLRDALVACLADPRLPAPEVAGEGGLTFRLKPVAIPEFGFINLYGTDVTAEKAIVRFPDQNPNPVLRLRRDGRMTYANPTSALVRAALGAEVGDALPPEIFTAVVAASERADDPTMEVGAGGRIYRLRVVSVYEFDSINLYGTDITAARQVEQLSSANETLLLNILPESIAARLRAGETPIADRFEDMAVLFADVVGFTELSSRLSPNAVVELLQAIFQACDELTDRFELEKIKTVGDAYMVAGGLHTVYGYDESAHAGHAVDVARMGLAIIEAVDRLGRERGLPLEMRVGMHVGPAVAGVIGRKKFIYDVWGDTVNTASRMESTGVPRRIQVTGETVARLGRAFEFEPRGLVDVKGKGRIETWLLVGPKAG